MDMTADLIFGLNYLIFWLYLSSVNQKHIYSCLIHFSGLVIAEVELYVSLTS
jgi:hypothetical protein